MRWNYISFAIASLMQLGSWHSFCSVVRSTLFCRRHIPAQIRFNKAYLSGGYNPSITKNKKQKSLSITRANALYFIRNTQRASQYCNIVLGCGKTKGDL